MIIGTFSQTETGYAGEIVTLTHRAQLALTAAERGADYQVTLDGIEVDAAWKKTARDTGKAYLSVKLDSPFLPAPVNCALMAGKDGSHILVWNREDRKPEKQA